MLHQIGEDVISLFYPRVCLACGNILFRNEDVLCFSCMYHLPKTGFHLIEDNPVARQFWGKIGFFSAASCYYFTKGSKVQHLVHQFKYKGYKEIGAYVGKLYGPELKKSRLFNSVSSVIPVPLHPLKLAKRGYNQAEWFAKGLAESMKTELDTSTLIRAYSSETQTRKSRFSRWENVREIFKVTDIARQAGKHVLLVDDVITTGSTLEAAGQTLLCIPGIQISVVSIACAVK
ncbi:MAG: ComF family protein [Bacteroidales bacterium]|nr:ComF family protein [Bacteroidales bacterium]MBK9356015.1 ComF family protein [Bacteroidales bacterium]